MTSTADAPATAAGPVATPRSLGLAAAVTLLANVVVYAVGRLAGVDFDVVSVIGDRAETVGPRAIVVMTLVPWLVGSLTLLLTRRWATRVWPWVGWAGAVLAVVTVPFFNEAAVTTRIALATMHLIAGAAWLRTATKPTRRIR